MADIKNQFENNANSPLEFLKTLGSIQQPMSNLVTGRAVQGAIGDDGTVDANKLGGLLKNSGPLGGMQAIPTLDAAQRLKQAGYDTSDKAMGNYANRMQVMDRQLFPLLSKKDLSTGDLHEAAVELLSHPEAKAMGITLPIIMSGLKQLTAMKDGKAPDSEELRARLYRMHGQVQSAGENLKAYMPQPVQTDLGGEIANTDQNPGSPTFGKVIGPTLPKQLLPTQPTIDNKTGKTSIIGERPPSVPGAMPNQNAEQKPLQTSLAAGEEQARTKTSEKAGELANRLTDAASQVPAQKALLGNIEDNLKNFEPGPAADWTKVAKAFSNRNLPLPSGMKFDPKSIASQEEFNKYATLLMQAQFQTLGGTGTDKQFGSTFDSNPNELMTKLGIKGVIHYLKGNQDAVKAMNKEWIKWREAGNDVSSYPEFQLKFNDQYDPRVFQFKYMTPQERMEYIKGMENEGELKKFKTDLAIARKKGWIDFGEKQEKK